MKKLFVLLMGLMFLAACASTTAPSKSLFLGEYENKLQAGPEGGAKLLWLKPGADFAKYNKFMVDYPVFALAPESEYKGIDGDEMKTLADNASKGLIEGISKEYTVVSEPGPDVVRIHFGIVDLKQSSPVLSGVTSVVPIGLGISLIKKGASDSYTGSGGTKAEVLIIDSTTNEVIGAAKDEYSAGFTERFSKWGVVEDAFKHWGERIAKFLTEAKTAKK